MRKNYEITEQDYLKAIEWLENGGTKKGACDILGVSNNKTMERLIGEFHDRLRVDKEQRAKKRKMAVTKEELAHMVTEYLRGDSMQDLSKAFYRSTDTIKHHLAKNGCLLREVSKIDPLNPPLLPDECMSDTFDIDQYVWAAKYGCIGQVKAQYKNAYRIRVWTDGTMEYSYQAPYELGSLKHIEALGVDLSKLNQETISTEEIAYALNKTLHEANKKRSKD